MCGSGDLRLVLRLPPTPPGDWFSTSADQSYAGAFYPLHVCECGSCGLVQLDTVVPPHQIYERYLYTTQSSPGLADYFSEAAQTIRQTVNLSKDDLVIDIGSNDGTLLKAFQPYAHVQGLEPSWDIGQAADHAGIPTKKGWCIPADATALVGERGGQRAKLVTAMNVIANVDDLETFFAGVNILLADDGWFVIETGCWPAIAQGLLIDTIEHEHLSYFSIASLRTLGFKYQLDLVKAEFTLSKGGSVRAYFKHGSVPPMLRPYDDDFIVWNAESVPRFQPRVDERCRVIHDVVDGLVATGRNVCAYGASVGGTTLLYACDLNGLIPCVLDDNPQRHGLFTPGAHLPVYPSSRIHEFDDVLVLAWRYLDRIRATHPDFKGRFITPLPDVRFISAAGPADPQSRTPGATRARA